MTFSARAALTIRMDVVHVRATKAQDRSGWSGGIHIRMRRCRPQHSRPWDHPLGCRSRRLFYLKDDAFRSGLKSVIIRVSSPPNGRRCGLSINPAATEYPPHGGSKDR